MVHDLRIENAAPYLMIILEYFEKNNTQTDLYSNQGNKDIINRLISNIRNFTPIFKFQNDLNRGLYSLHDISWSIVEILNCLNHPLLLENYNEAYIVNAYYEDIDKIKTCILELPDLNIQIVLKLFGIFKKLVTQEYHSSFILLSPEIIGDTFSNVLMRFKNKDEIDIFGNKIFATNVISCLISHYNEIFDDAILDFEKREQKSKDSAILFMEYAMKKYTSLDNHFRSIYNNMYPYKKNLTAEDVKTIKTEFNLRKFSGRANKTRPPIPIYL